jgi:signal transduction histidine kinase
VDVSPLPEAVYLDRGMWEKAVFNLLSNAFKFTFEGEIRVTVGLTDDGRSARLAVSDTGTGIQPHELPRVFERFHRVEGARGRSFEGSGIGLALTQELVKLHGGEIGDVLAEEGRHGFVLLQKPYAIDCFHACCLKRCGGNHQETFFPDLKTE